MPLETRRNGQGCHRWGPHEYVRDTIRLYLPSSFCIPIVYRCSILGVPFFGFPIHSLYSRFGAVLHTPSAAASKVPPRQMTASSYEVLYDSSCSWEYTTKMGVISRSELSVSCPENVVKRCELCSPGFCTAFAFLFKQTADRPDIRGCARH